MNPQILENSNSIQVSTDQESKNYLKKILEQLKLSISDDSKIINAIDKIKSTTGKVIGISKDVTKKSIVAANKISYIFIARFPLFITFIYAFFFYNDVIFITIKNIINTIFELVKNYASFFTLNPTISTIYSNLIIILIYLFVIISLFPSIDNQWKKNIYSKQMSIFWISTLFIIIWGSFASPDLGFSENFEIIGEKSSSSFSNTWLNFKCNNWGNLLNYPECIKLKKTDKAEVTEQEKITISFDKEYSNRPIKTLNSIEEGYSVRYKFETQVPITLLKIECYTNKDLKTPFYTQEITEDNIINKDISKKFECLNLGKVLEKNKENLEIITKLEFTVDNTFTQDVLVLNCKNPNLKNKLEEKDYKCNELQIKDLKELYPNYLNMYQEKPQGSNVVDLEFYGFKDEMPITIGDEISEKFDLNIGIKKNRDLGKLETGKIIKAEIPKSLISLDEKLNQPSEEIDQINGEIFLSYKLEENEGFDMDEEDILIINKLILITRNRIVKEGRTDNIEVKANFEIPNKEETTPTNNEKKTTEDTQNDKEITTENTEKFDEETINTDLIS